jgi:hypothetical protein
MQAFHARRHGCARWPLLIAPVPRTSHHARRPGGFRVESMSRASSAGSQPPRCSESNAVVSSPSSHSAGLASLGYPSRAPANHSCTQLGGALESERRPTARPMADWAVSLSGLGGGGAATARREAKAKSPAPWRARMLDGHPGWGLGTGGAAGSKRPAAGRPAKSPSLPSAVAYSVLPAACVTG